MSAGGVRYIGNEAFYDCDSLTDVIFSSCLERIGDNAFYSCAKLHTVELPSALTYIGQYAFRNTDLTDAVFGNTNGWYYTSNYGDSTGTTLASSDLSNSMTAATWLDSTYTAKYWKRNA